MTATDNTTEIWKTIPDWEDYEASSQGRIRRARLERPNGNTYVGKILQQGSDTKGYPHVGLCRYGKIHTTKVHKLVAATFIGPRPEGLQVNHKDGVKTNNCVDNLEYVTNDENIKHATEHGLRAKGEGSGYRRHPESFPKGEQSYCAKLTEADVIEIRRLRAEGVSGLKLAKRFGVSSNRIYQIGRGLSWKHIT